MAEGTNIETRSSYRSIFKSISLFGGVQAYQILIQVIKSKFIAVLLGPAGVGIMGLYQSATDLVKQVTSLGISQSAVRDVSEANGSGDTEKINRTVTVLRKIVWFTGIFGMIVVSALSPTLSKTSFGNYDYTIPFLFLSVTLLLDQLCSGQKVVLQGMRRIKDLAKSSAIGATLGLIVSVPLYYILGVKGIVPTMILNAIATFIISWLYACKVKIDKVEVTPREIVTEGKNMMVMGIAMSMSGILSMGVAYALRGFIRSQGGTEEVGLFQAGSVIVNSYVGLIFNAISTDYYPRLAAINKDNAKCSEVISQQGEIGTLILAPMLTICMVFMPIALQILYSDEFIAANEFIILCCMGMMLRLASWVISYVFVAKAESKLFMVNEIAGNLYYLLFSLLGYKLFGLEGMGIAFAVNYLIYFMQVYLIARFRYGFHFSASFIRTFVIQFVLVGCCLFIVLSLDGVLKYIVGTLVIVVSVLLAFKGLNNRTGLLDAIKSKIHR